jgi:ribosomal protein S18 acetylase RimI-like enzyme
VIAVREPDLQAPVTIDWHRGPRAELRALFELAEDSAEQLAGYGDLGRVLVARSGSLRVGHLQLVPTGIDGEIEVKNMAVITELQGAGIGRALIEEAVRRSERTGSSRMVVATATADTGNIRFYQRVGFRMRRVEPDAFTPDTGYPEPIMIDGIELRDRVWFDRELTAGAG